MINQYYIQYDNGEKEIKFFTKKESKIIFHRILEKRYMKNNKGQKIIKIVKL
jgi:hypothetical protein